MVSLQGAEEGDLRHRDQGKRPCEDEDRDGSFAAQAKEDQAPSEPGTGMEGFSQRLWRKCGSTSLFTSRLLPLEL